MTYNPTQVWNGETTHVATVGDNTDFDLGATYTIECWFKAESWNTVNGFVGKWQTSGNNRSYVFRIFNDSGDIKIQMATDSDGVAGGATVHTSDVVTTSSDLDFHHYAVSVSSGTSTFYFDGVSSGGSTGLSTPYNSTASVAIGAERTDGTDGADGSFGLVRIWKGVARSGTEINDNKCVLLGSTTNLSSEWSLDGVYTDNSGNGHTLTNSGGAFETDGPSTCSAVFVPKLMWFS